jgi:hypothetical protein
MLKYDLRTGVKKIKTKTALAVTAVVLSFSGLGMAVAVPALSQAAGGGGFDPNGYNNQARIFNGTNGSWCVAQGIDPTPCADYGNVNDKLVMKWNAAWDACNAHYNVPSACSGAWLTNEVNGKVPNGSGTTEHYKIVWINHNCGADLAPTPDGGQCIWGNYEIIMDQGNDGSGHFSNAHVTPNGFGVLR